VSHDHVQGLDGLEGDVGQPPRQRLVEGLQAHAGHPFDGHLEAAVLALARNGHLELHLTERETGTKREGERAIETHREIMRELWGH